MNIAMAMAYRLGDPTPEASGRLTLNPLAHLDIFGTLMLLLFRFGWAKPVPIDPRHFKRPGRDIILVSLAGAAGNILTAVICGLAVRLFPTLFWANLAWHAYSDYDAHESRIGRL